MVPIRTCLGCRGHGDQADLLRLVRVGDAVVDGTAPRLPGRGGYLHRDPACWELAERRRAVQRFFGPGTELAPGLARDWEHGVPAR